MPTIWAQVAAKRAAPVCQSCLGAGVKLLSGRWLECQACRGSGKAK